MKTHGMLAMAAAICLSACATAPSQIIPRPIDVSEYRDLSCPDLTSRAAQTQTRLDVLSASQRRTRTIDTVGVALVFLPVGSLFGGDHEREIGELKWREHVLQRDIDANGCDAAAAAVNPAGLRSN